jgi:hypothetical protein
VLEKLRKVLSLAKFIGRHSIDPRLEKLQRKGSVCRSCGKVHRGLFDLAFEHPVQWQEIKDASSSSEQERSVLLEDICVVNSHDYFVRGVLEIPIIGFPNERFGYGIWSSLSKNNFDYYMENSDKDLDGTEEGWFGWFSNHLQGYPDTVNLKCKVVPRSGRLRPLIYLEPTEHPLSVEQRTGITLDRVFEVYRLNGHDFG